MLSWTCRRFRARFTPGSEAPHRRACQECDAYAAALERAAGVRLPLPSGLRDNLQKIAAPGPGSVLPFPVPQIPVPPGLQVRLRALGRPEEARPKLPAWLRSPRYAVAASYLLALFLGAAFGNPIEWGREAAASLTVRVEWVWRHTEELISPEQTRDPARPGPQGDDDESR